MLAPSQTAAASSKVMPVGMGAIAALSGMQTYSACRAEALDAEDVVADLELGDGGADGLDLAGELDAEDPVLRPAKAGEEAGEERLRAAPAAVRPVDRGGVDLDEDLVVFRDRPLDLFEPQYLRRPVPVVDNRSHAFTPSPRLTGSSLRGAPFTVRTTFPVFCAGLDVPVRLDDVLQRVASGR